LLAIASDVSVTATASQASEIAACASADARGLQWSIVIFICGYAWAALHYLLAGRTLQQDMVANSAE